MHPLLKELERDNDPHDVIEIAPGVVLAGRAEPEFATVAPGGQNRPAEPQIHLRPSESAAAQAPSLDTTFRAEDVHHGRADRSSAGAWARRVFIGILLSVCGAVAAAPWQHYGDAAKAMIATWVPQLVATSSPPANPAPSEQPVTPDSEAAATRAAPVQPAPQQPAAPAPVQSTEAGAPTSPSPEQVQSLAAMAQQIEQLKASVEQLKAGQEQMSRDIARASDAKASEANLRPRIPAPKMAALPPRPATAPARKPRSAFSAAPYAPPPLLPPQAAPAVAPQAAPAPQVTVETDGNPVVRPPLPLR
jgi:hypothetical protein